MADYITIYELEFAINSIDSYIATGDKSFLEKAQNEIKKAKKIDFSIKTHGEYDAGKFIETDHNPGRMAIFLLNAYGEFYLDNGIITIFDDDPYVGKASHDNTYRLELKDKETHTKIFEGNPTPEDEPYDFNAKFIKQITRYSNGEDDTTRRAWDSFALRYNKPFRNFDFKSAFWKNKNTHQVTYILKLTFDKQLLLLTNFYPEGVEKKFTFEPNSNTNINYYNMYYKLLSKIEILGRYIWDNFILD